MSFDASYHWFAWIATALMGVLSIHYFNANVIKKYARKAELKNVSEKALKEIRETKQACLRSPGGDAAVMADTVQATKELFQKDILTPVQNVANLAKRCRQYGRGKVNAITEELYDNAYEVAQNIDKSGIDMESKHLYGVAISIKDSINQKGHYATAGLQCRMYQRSDHDALIVKVLKKAGAIPLCRGNVPQLLMSMECNNRVWGPCLNPWDLTRSSGGSTGGDAALVSMGCVTLACGSDVAGSCRVPASFCGIIGFKSSNGRLSMKGAMTPRKNDRNGTAISIPATVGPLARTVDDCAAFMKAACVPDFWKNDLSLPKLPFDNKEYTNTTPMKIGYFKTDDWFQPCSASRRGLEETIVALEKAGHTLVPFELPASGWEVNRLLVGLNAADGNMRNFEEGLEGEDFVDEYKFLYTISNMPEFLRCVVKMGIDKRRSFLLECAKYGGLKVYDYHHLTQDLLNYRSKWSDAFVASGIDAVIYPAMPMPAVPHGLSQKLTSSATYMFIANLLLWPCGSVPVTIVGPDEQHYRPEDLPEDQRDLMSNLVEIVMENSAGMPLSVNVMTPAFQDEKCLRVMNEVEKVVQFQHEPAAYKEA